MQEMWFTHLCMSYIVLPNDFGTFDNSYSDYNSRISNKVNLQF